MCMWRVLCGACWCSPGCWVYVARAVWRGLVQRGRLGFGRGGGTHAAAICRAAGRRASEARLVAKLLKHVPALCVLGYPARWAGAEGRARCMAGPVMFRRWGAVGQPSAAPIARQNLATMGVEDRNRACVEALERYVVACGGSADLVKNWTVTRGVLY